jgi:uncharacterized protein YdeI (YjbR/CyaY-like superfamily)
MTSDVRFFRSAGEFRRWLEANHARADELFVGFHKKASGRGGMTYAEAVDEALCFGWIDGVRRRIDDESFSNRFSPRRPGSIWSAVNVQNVERLMAEGRMRPAGLTAFAKRDPERSSVYSFERSDAALDPAQERRFRSNGRAWAFWCAQPKGYRKTATWWVISAKREETRSRRLATLIDLSAKGERIPALVSPTRRAEREG